MTKSLNCAVGSSGQLLGRGAVHPTGVAQRAVGDRERHVAPRGVVRECSAGEALFA